MTARPQPIRLQYRATGPGNLALSKEQAWDEVQDSVHWMLTVYGKWMSEAGELQGPLRTLFQSPPASEPRRTADPLLFAPIVGAAKDVAERLDQFTRKVRTTHLVVGMHFPGIDPKIVRRSMETFARELLPGLQKQR